MVIPLPRELRGKQSYSVVRIHDGSVDTLDGTPNSDGEFIETDSEKTAITLHAKNFSTYAIAYTERSSTGGHGGSGGGGGGSSIPKKRPQPTLPTETAEEMTQTASEVILTEATGETKTEEAVQPKGTQTGESRADVADSGNDGGEISETSRAEQLPDEENHTEQYKDAGLEESKERSAVCGLCHICPTFLGVCLFVWLAIAGVLVIWVCRKKREK